MNVLKIILISILFLQGNRLVYAGFERDFSQAKEAYHQYHRNEQNHLFEAAWSAFKNLEEEYPNHPAVNTYLGSLEAIRGGNSWMPWSKLKWVEQGLDRIDRAMSLLESGEYDAISGGISIADDCRLIAVSTFLGVPAFLNRFQDGKDVFHDLTETRDLTGLPLTFQKVIYQLGAVIADKEGDTDSLKKWQQQLNKLQ